MTASLVNSFFPAHAWLAGLATLAGSKSPINFHTMEKEHYYRVTWITKTTKSVGCGRIETERSYSRECPTEAEAIKKARQVSRNASSHSIRIAEMEYWQTPLPEPNGTIHVTLLGFVNWRTA